MRDHGLPGDWWYSDDEREALRARALDGHAGDLWIFAYGSLMWDPAFRFAEVRRAHAPGHQRRFILKDVHGARGKEDEPGLMAALDTGAGCNGLAFRIAVDEVEAETEILWRREQVLPAYNAEFIDVDLPDTRVSALTFVADLDADVIAGDLTREEQIRYFATGNGFLGASLDYLVNIESHFEKLDIIDDDVIALLRDTRAYIAAAG